MQKIYENARKLMKGYCRVCPECNGVACAGEVPGMGGAWHRSLICGKCAGA